MMRALVYGATGLVGRHLVRELEKRKAQIYTSPWAANRSAQPMISHVFNAIGYTDIERAEQEPAAAFRSNAGMSRMAAGAAEHLDAVLVHVSTEFVFDGNDFQERAFIESDAPQPLSVYARSKRAGELPALARSRHHVVRLQNLYGEGGRNLLSRICSGRFDGGALDTERKIAPMWAGTAARILCDIAESRLFGTWHATVRNRTTYSGFAESLDVKHLPAKSDAMVLSVRRPSIHLSCNRAELFGMQMPTWRESLNEWRAK